MYFFDKFMKTNLQSGRCYIFAIFFNFFQFIVKSKLIYARNISQLSSKQKKHKNLKK